MKDELKKRDVRSLDLGKEGPGTQRPAKHYLTTPIYYASGSPHLGHAYTTLVADCYKRYHLLRGDEVLLTTGTDEHGQKIERTAEKNNETILAFIDGRSAEFAECWKGLNIDVDLFARASDETHKELVVEFWKRLNNNGDIYKSRYEGLYCVDCEQYFTDGDECPVHRKALEHFSEESYFFRLGKYQNALIDHIEGSAGFIVPESRRNEVLSFLKKNELHDLSISRTSTRWGIKVPGDDEHVIYVWLDALATYLSALGSLDSDQLAAFWPNSTHFIGKDILFFHAIYWPAFLWSAGLALPKKLVVNGWLTVEGRKFSKSDPETIIDPQLLANTIGSDGLKYYFLKTVTLGQDLDFNQSHLLELLNADLANNLGNLFSRFFKLFLKHFPEGVEFDKEARSAGSKELRSAVGSKIQVFVANIEDYQLSQASRTFIEISALINANIQQTEPWKITSRSELGAYLWNVHHCLAGLSLIGLCFVPELAVKARVGLCLEHKPGWVELHEARERVSVQAIENLFPRL